MVERRVPRWSELSRDMGFDNRIIEFDCHVYPAGSSSVTHKHNEAVIFILKGSGHTLIDEERIDWGPGDTLYIRRDPGTGTTSTPTSRPWWSRPSRFRCRSTWAR